MSNTNCIDSWSWNVTLPVVKQLLCLEFRVGHSIIRSPSLKRKRKPSPSMNRPSVFRYLHIKWRGASQVSQCVCISPSHVMLHRTLYAIFINLVYISFYFRDYNTFTIFLASFSSFQTFPWIPPCILSNPWLLFHSYYMHTHTHC